MEFPPDSRHHIPFDQKTYDFLFDNFIDPIVVADFNGKLIKANKCFHSVLGYGEELFREPFMSFVHPDDREQTEFQIETLRKGEPTSNFVNRYRCKDGNYKYIEWTCIPAGENYILAMGRDITEQRHRQESFLELLLENIPDMIFVKEARELRFVRFNKAGEDLLGYSRSDLIGKNDIDFFPPDQAEYFIEKDRAVLNGKVVVDFPEEPVQTKHQGKRILHTKKIPILDANGNPEYLLGISEDITEKKQAEEARQKMYQEQIARKEVESTLKARDEFISIASHELKSPLASLKLQAQMFHRNILKAKKEAYSPEKIDLLLMSTEKHVDRLDRLVNDMLDVSRISSGKLTMDWSQFNLYELLREITSQEKEHFFELDSSKLTLKSSRTEIYGTWDRMRLEQVIINLLSNAHRYGSGNPVELSLSTHADKVLILVQDQGIGIAPDDLTKIFNRFERAVNRNEVSGLGLGLFISRQIVEAHHGRIWAESTLGKGSTFFVELPRDSQRVNNKSEDQFSAS